MNTGTLEPRARTTPQADSVGLGLNARIIPARTVATALPSDGTPDVRPYPA
ncbi:hypothetical protein [Streptomyces sp. NPDC005538]|uniref:hypothetical protein n=1 Tax=Streptomyces sp. NPDC005538 TaxID=3157043 RepID=UPI0033BA5DB9